MRYIPVHCDQVSADRVLVNVNQVAWVETSENPPSGEAPRVVLHTSDGKEFVVTGSVAGDFLLQMWDAPEGVEVS